MKILKYSAAIAVATIMSASHAQADCGEISMTEMDWGSAIIVTQVSKFLLEQGYGCQVTVVPSASVPALASVSETGEPDILTEIWTNGAPAYPGLVEAGKIKELTNVLSDGGVEGWWVPKYLVDAHPELKTLEGVKANPELVGGRLHNCPVGWTCQTITTNMHKAAGLEAVGIEDFVHGSGETLAASIASAYQAKEPWFGYYWAPTSILGKYPMVLVDIGPHDPAGHECNSNQECATPVVGAFPTSIVTTVVTDTFSASHPDESALMQNVTFTNTQMGELLAWQEDNNASGQEAAVHFLTNYKSVWKEWLNDSAREKLAAILN